MTMSAGAARAPAAATRVDQATGSDRDEEEDCGDMAQAGIARRLGLELAGVEPGIVDAAVEEAPADRPGSSAMTIAKKMPP